MSFLFNFLNGCADFHALGRGSGFWPIALALCYYLLKSWISAMIEPFHSTLSIGNTRMRKTQSDGSQTFCYTITYTNVNPHPPHDGAMTERSRAWWAPSRADLTWSGDPTHPECSHCCGLLPAFFFLSSTFPQISASTSSTSIILASDEIGKQISDLKGWLESVPPKLWAQSAWAEPFPQGPPVKTKP